MIELPPSLTVSPNISAKSQTIEQLIAERQYWNAEISSATRWSAALGVASEFRDECDSELLRRFL